MRRAAALAAWMLLAAAPQGLAQGGERPVLTEGRISGTVIDAQSSTPLGGASIVLEPEEQGAVSSRSRTGGSAFLQAARTTVSDAGGAYRFDDLAPGRYHVRVSRVGYRPATLSVELRGAADSRVSVGLSVQPIPLEAVDVRSEAAQPFGRDRLPEEERAGSRAAAARSRQRQHLASDARELTHADVVEAVTLGETDLFRALQRLPGVSTRDDYTAELWTRGASWDQTRVRFDGLPLFNPVHALGVFSGVNPDAVGGAMLHPGVRPASLGDGAAAVVDLTSRRGGGQGELRGTGDLSLASARLALDQRFLDGRGAWMLAGRRTYLDLLTAGIERAMDLSDAYVPYSFSDLTGRFDYRIDDERAVEVSALVERDRITGDVPDVVHGTRATWGNTAARATYAGPLLGLQARHTLGLSRYAAISREFDPDSARTDGFNAPEEPRGDNTLLHLAAAGELAPAPSSTGHSPWRVGYELVHQRSGYDGPASHPYAGYRPADAQPLSRRSSLSQSALWAERRWAPASRLVLETGLRVEAGAAVADGGSLRLAPRVSARYALSQEVSLSAGAGRTYQYVQALGPVGITTGPALSAARLWLLADEEVPAIRADVATLGGEAWLGASWLLSANAYLRRTTGIALPDPTPGPLVQRPLFVTGENDAHGVEIGARRLAGRWTASVSYSFGVSEMQAAGLRFAAPADRRHSLDATTMLRVGNSLRLGAAYTLASGAPFTRVWVPEWSCYANRDCDQVPRVGEPNAQRTRDYASLDLLVDWTHRFRTWDLGAYLQLRNALWHNNDLTYTGSHEVCTGSGYASSCQNQYALVDSFEMGLPILPVFGFRVRF